MAPLFTQLLKPNTSESSLRPVFLSSFLFSPSASPVFSASLVDAVPGTPRHLYAPTLVPSTLISCLGCCKYLPNGRLAFTSANPSPIHYAASHPLLPSWCFSFHASHTGFLAAFPWQGLCTCCACFLECSDPRVCAWFPSLSFRTHFKWHLLQEAFAVLCYSTALFHILLLFSSERL